mgnify:CR=1 FL=1
MELIQFYCINCREKVMLPVEAIALSTLSNGHPSGTGACPKCGMKIFKILPGNEAAAIEAINNSTNEKEWEQHYQTETGSKCGRCGCALTYGNDAGTNYCKKCQEEVDAND